MAAGDVLILATDGILESRSRGSHDFFGLHGLSAAVESLLSEPEASSNRLDAAAAGIVDAAKVYAKSPTLKDDACVLLIQRRSAGGMSHDTTRQDYEPAAVGGGESGGAGAAATVAAP